MTNSKSLKRALLTSIIALVVCFSMLVGTTFAWFTDSVTSSGNIIQTGKLDVTLEYSDSILGQNDAGWKNANTDEGAQPVFNYTKWEPGYSVVKYVKVENEGTLDFKFKISIIPRNATTGANLADVIEVYTVDSAVAVTRDMLTTTSSACRYFNFTYQR